VGFDVRRFDYDAPAELACAPAASTGTGR
jgi:hypothetical protein